MCNLKYLRFIVASCSEKDKKQSVDMVLFVLRGKIAVLLMVFQYFVLVCNGIAVGSSRPANIILRPRHDVDKVNGEVHLPNATEPVEFSNAVSKTPTYGGRWPHEDFTITISGTPRRPGWEYIRLGKTANLPQPCASISEMKVKTVIRDGLEIVEQNAARHADVHTRAVEDPIFERARVPWSRCSVDLALKPAHSPGGSSLLMLAFVREAFDALFLRLVLNGPANLHMELWEWGRGWTRPYIVGGLGIRIQGPDAQ